MTLPPAHFEPEFAPLELLPILIPAALYWLRAAHLAQRGRPVPLWRQLCFAGGLLAIALSLVGLGELSDELLWPHMLEHLVIGDLAAILLVLGLTGPLLQPILAIKPLDRLRVLAHPAVALPLWAIDLYLWHLPALYQATLTNNELLALGDRDRNPAARHPADGDRRRDLAGRSRGRRDADRLPVRRVGDPRLHPP